MTMAWWAGEDAAERASEYSEYLRTIYPNLPSCLQELAGLPIHDSNLRQLRVLPSNTELTLELDLADGNRLVVCYSGVSSFISTGTPDEGLSGPGGYGDLGYDEVDIGPDGYFVHRLLFSNAIEFEIIFLDVKTISARPDSSQKLARPGAGPAA